MSGYQYKAQEETGRISGLQDQRYLSVHPPFLPLPSSLDPFFLSYHSEAIISQVHQDASPSYN